MKTLLFSMLIIILGLGHSQSQEKARQKVEKSFYKILKKENVHNGFLQIKSGDESLDWQFVGGEFQDGTSVNQANPFHAASVGKMFTAALVLRLVEQGELQLQDAVSKHLDSKILQGLHVFEGKDYSSKITIQQLLQHTSGLPDYLMDKPKNDDKTLLQSVLNKPDKFWSVEDILAFSKENLDGRFKPGEGYYYTDTEYILLGLIIEKKLEKPLHQAFLDEIFRPLDMQNTSLYSRSEPVKKTGRIAEFYFNDTEISTYTSLSIDWAGGGIVTTTEDLMKFQQALSTGKLVSVETYQTMQAWIIESHGSYYGLGLRKYELKEFSKLLPELSLVGHSGINAAFSFYCPELDVYLTGSFNQTEQMEQAIKFLFQTLITLQYERS